MTSTPATLSAYDAHGLRLALAQAEKSYAEGGIPIGGALLVPGDQDAEGEGTVLGAGHNQRVQRGSATLHGEISTLENAGRLGAGAYRRATMYTTLRCAPIHPPAT